MAKFVGDRFTSPEAAFEYFVGLPYGDRVSPDELVDEFTRPSAALIAAVREELASNDGRRTAGRFFRVVTGREVTTTAQLDEYLRRPRLNTGTLQIWLPKGVHRSELPLGFRWGEAVWREDFENAPAGVAAREHSGRWLVQAPDSRGGGERVPCASQGGQRPRDTRVHVSKTSTITGAAVRSASPPFQASRAPAELESKLSWWEFHCLRVGLHRIAALRSRHTTDRDGVAPGERVRDNSELRQLLGQIARLRTMFQKYWTEEDDLAAAKDLGDGRRTRLVQAAMVQEAMETFDGASGSSEWGAIDAEHESDADALEDDGQPDLGYLLFPKYSAKQMVRLASRFGVTRPRDLAAVASMDRDSMPEGYGDYFIGAHGARRSSTLWKKVAAAVREDARNAARRAVPAGKG